MLNKKNRLINKSSHNFIKNIFWSFLISTLVVIVGLVIEYKSGIFQNSNPSDKNLANYYFSLIIIGLIIIISLSLINSLRIIFGQHQYFREQLSLLFFFTVIFACILLILSLVTGILPWSIPLAFYKVFIARTVFQLDTRWIDHAFLLSLFILLILTLNRLHKNWHGLKSIEQHQREQRNETLNYFTEGFNELRRLKKNEQPLKIYSEINKNEFIPQLEPVKDTLIWKDQAKELIRLTSSSYDFALESNWHDKQNCWVGKNVNTGRLVFLLPISGKINENELKEFLDYVQLIATNDSSNIGEIIIATKNDTAKSILKWKDITIRYETEDSLLGCLVDFKDYFNEIKRRAIINPLPDSALTLSDVYVPSMFFSHNGEKQTANIESFLNTWLGEPGQRQIALLGEYGQGKSTATLMWAYHIITNGLKLTTRIPLLIELRGTSPRNLTPLQLLGAWAAQYNINPQALIRLLIAGRLVLVFEGFDEMALVGDAEMRLKHFRTLWQFAYPNAKILITGRPNFFLDEKEMIAALGISKPVGERPYCEALRLAPFSSRQIKEALRTYNDSVRDQIHSLVKNNRRFRELVSRPSLLHIVAVLWEREQLVDKVDKLTSAYVMDLFIRHSYRRQGLKEWASPEFMALTTLEREYFMTGIAAYMASKNLPNQITGTQLNETIGALISTIPEAISTESTAISGETTQPLHVRLRDTKFGIEHVKTDVRACGLLADDPAAPGTFRFGHKSFMEYLIAAVITERIQNTKSEKANAILKATNMRVEDILLFSVAIDFLSELLVGIREDKESDQKTKEIGIAHRLFKTIISENYFMIFLIRPVIFFESLTYGLSRKMSPLGRIQLRASFLFIIGFPSIIMIILLRIFEVKNDTFVGKNFDIPMMIAIFLSAMFSSTMMLFSNGLLKRKLQLWSQLCRRLGVNDKVLHKIAGTNIIPWIREQPFEFNYLSHPESEGNSSVNKG